LLMYEDELDLLAFERFNWNSEANNTMVHLQDRTFGAAIQKARHVNVVNYSVPYSLIWFGRN